MIGSSRHCTEVRKPVAIFRYPCAMHISFFQRLMLSVYSAGLYLLLPLTLYHLIWRGLRQRAYMMRWSERYAHIDALPELNNAIWVHAVSVGEINAAVPLINALKEQYPQRPILITTITPTGSERVRSLWGDGVNHVYLPYDLRALVRRFLQRVRPSIAIIVETEIWPNLFVETAKQGIPLVIANARLSERSLKGYAYLSPLIRLALSAVNLICAQSQPDARRFVRLGAADSKVCVSGNLKYDLALPEDTVNLGKHWRGQWQQSPVWIIASSHLEEEPTLAEFHVQLLERIPNLRLIWVPRHPERFNAVFERCQDMGLQTIRRSSDQPPTAEDQVLLVDSMGELLQFLAAADVCFVAGSIKPVGGHNVLEPAALGVPVVVGPHIFNFQQVCAGLEQVGALKQGQSSAQMIELIDKWLRDAPAAEVAGKAGQEFVAANRGSVARTLQLIAQHLNAARS